MKNFKKDINNSLQILTRGGIILYPTDTIWGLGCDATKPDAVKKIYRLKKREEKKSMIILLPQESDIKKYVFHPSEKILNFLSKQDSPTTAIFDNAINLPQQLINADGTIAIRIVRDPFCQALLQQFKQPLVSTSANVSGDASPQNFMMISDQIKSGVDYIVQHRQDELQIFQPSSIIRLTDAQEIEKIR